MAGSRHGTVVDIHKDYRYHRLFIKRWYEYPVIASYKAGSGWGPSNRTLEVGAEITSWASNIP